MLFLQQTLIRLFRDNLRHSFWKWAGDTKHQQIEEAKAQAKQQRRFEKRSALRIQRWWRRLHFKANIAASIQKYKVGYSISLKLVSTVGGGVYC